MIFKWQEQPWKAWTRLRERLPHAILIQSGEGMGEFEFAQACAQSQLCERPQPDQRACGTCHACNWFSLGNHPDFRLIVPESMAPDSREEGAEPSKKRSEQIRIEQARELADFLAVGTHRGGVRVILIYPAEAMNANTQNALLKNLEEPPPATVFLLVTTQPERLLATVRSRCLKFALPFPPLEPVLRWLKEQGVRQPEATLAGAGGAPLAALKAADTDRKSTRLNSSHLVISYAVFCLKKKKLGNCVGVGYSSTASPFLTAMLPPVGERCPVCTYDGDEEDACLLPAVIDTLYEL